jgi:hypothetical protein
MSSTAAPEIYDTAASAAHLLDSIDSPAVRANFGLRC